MPVTTMHRQYSAFAAKWKRCRDAYSGSDAVKDAGEAYLPRLGDQTDLEYKAYKTRALWYGATKRTVQGLSGAVMRKEPAITLKNEELKQDLENVTLNGVSLSAFAKTVIEETLQVGRCGVLCDMSDDAAIPASERRPYWSFYAAEAIKNWHIEIRGGVPVLVKVVLYEESEQQKGADEFEYECKPQYRVLRLNAEGNYEVQVYTKAAGAEATKEGEWIPGPVTIPQRRGAPLKYIPFVFINPTSVTPEIEDPPLIDLVDVNLSHYLTSADLEHGRHFCGLPTVWATGIPADTKMKVGSSVVLTSSDPKRQIWHSGIYRQGIRRIGDRHGKQRAANGRTRGATVRAAEARCRVERYHCDPYCGGAFYPSIALSNNRPSPHASLAMACRLEGRHG
jgi:hypothetical protein